MKRYDKEILIASISTPSALKYLYLNLKEERWAVVIARSPHGRLEKDFTLPCGKEAIDFFYNYEKAGRVGDEWFHTYALEEPIYEV